MALLSWDGQIINALVNDWPRDVEGIFKDEQSKIDLQVRGGCFGRQQFVQCGFSSRPAIRATHRRFTYESGDTLLHLGNRTHHLQRSCASCSRKGPIHAKNSKGETAEDLTSQGCGRRSAVQAQASGEEKSGQKGRGQSRRWSARRLVMSVGVAGKGRGSRG